MKIYLLKDRNMLKEYFCQDISLHIYSLGDLDDFYWPITTCLGLSSPAGVEKAALLYRGEGLPVLLVLDHAGNLDREFIEELIPLLPDKFYAHLSPGIESFFSHRCDITDCGIHQKMELQGFDFLTGPKVNQTRRIKENDLKDLIDLYQTSYPGNGFDPRLIKTGFYFGSWQDSRLISAGGVHVYSQKYNVAALGNITTHPDFRNRGFAKLITSRICRELKRNIDNIGLNVKSDNLAAIQLYSSLGFVFLSHYGEFSLKKKP